MTDDEILAYVLKFEGGFTNNANDHGGPTNFGITAAEYGRFLGQDAPASAAQVQAMTREQAIQIYRTRYIAQPGYAAIADGILKLVVVDSGVLFGTGRATRWLQQALGVGADGVIGPQTTGALSAATPALTARKVLALRFRAIADIVANDASQLVFLRGWTNRAAALLELM
jgi:lysozyme family protein